MNGIFPSKSLLELAKIVREADGSFDLALTMLMSADDANASSFVPKVSVVVEPPVSRPKETVSPAECGGLEFDANVDLASLRARFGKLVPSIVSVLGSGVQNEYTILQTLEKAKGDTQEAVLALLSMPEQSSGDKPNALRSSREALRLSATHITASSSLRSSSGLEELPLNVDLDHLDSKNARFFPASPSASKPADAEDVVPLFPSAPAPSPSSSVSSSDSALSSYATISVATSSNEDSGHNIGDDHMIMDEYDDDEWDDDSWLTDPLYQEVREAVFGTDFITQMMQEEYDAMVARELAQQLAAGVPENSILIASANQGAQTAPTKPRVWPSALPVSVPVVSDPAKPCARKWDPFKVPSKKQRPSGPKYYERVPASPPAAAPQPAPSQDPSTSIDKKLLEEFVAAHPVTYLQSGQKRSDLAPMLPLRARVDESLEIALTIKQLKQLYAARLPAMESQFTHSKKKSTPSNNNNTSSSGPSTNTESNASKNEQENAAAVPTAAAIFDITAEMEKLFKAATPKTPEECLSLQRTELRELRHLLSLDRVHVSESAPTVVAITLQEPTFEISRPAGIVGTGGDELSHLTTTLSFQNPLHLLLVVSLPTLYPDLSPIISVRSLMPSCPIDAAQFELLASHLRVVVKQTFGRPGLAELVLEAEKWLSENPSVRKAALMDFQKANTPSSIPGSNVDQYEPQMFSSLNRIFNFDGDFTILNINDVLTQRERLIKRAIILLINGPAVVNPITPGNLANDGQSSEEFPVRIPGTGEIDEEASLRGLGLTVASVRVILQHYNWNLGRLSSAYLNSLTRGTFEAFLSETGVAPVADRYAMQYHLPRALTEVLECPTCLEYRPFHAMFGLVCGHMLCKECYSEYVDYEVSRGAGLASLSCPSPGCKYIVDQVSLAGLLSASRWAQYVNMTVSQFVQVNPALSWCPSGKGCQHLVQIGELDHDGISAVLAGQAVDELPVNPAGDVKSVTKAPVVVQCKCSFTFCSCCSRIGGHFPATCSECDTWDKHHPGDAVLRDHDVDNLLSMQFVRSHTKLCPQCGAAISKNGGCVHMMCVACRHEFCWVCSGNWTPKHYTCSEGRAAPGDADDVSIAKSHKNFDSLLLRHREFSCAVVGKLKQKLTTAMYRTEKLDEKKCTPGANAANAAHLKLDKLLTIEDVPAFIDSLEMLYLGHYIITNACKAGYSLTSQQISSNSDKNALISLIHRGLEDIRFLTLAFEFETLRKVHIFHLNAGLAPLKTTIKLIVNQLNSIRMSHLAKLARRM